MFEAGSSAVVSGRSLDCSALVDKPASSAKVMPRSGVYSVLPGDVPLPLSHHLASTVARPQLH